MPSERAAARDEGRIGYEFKGIAKVLADAPLSVPPYQRSYSWEDEQVVDLWDDVQDARRAGAIEYFLGAIILTSTDSNLTIIDGQQRLATVSMLAAALRDAFLELGDEKRAGKITEEFLASEDFNTLALRPHLNLNTQDNHFYLELVIESKSPEPKCESHRFLKAAFFELCSRVQSEMQNLATPEDQLEALLEWREFIEDKAKVIVVHVPSESDAYLIFETLNDRGKDLTLADLLKNYLFQCAGGRLEEVKQYWSTTTALMDGTGVALVTFIRHHWASLNGMIRERDLYKAIKRKVRTSNDAVKYSKQLAEGARMYLALLGADMEYWAELGTEGRRHVETLNRFGLEQYRPMLLAAMASFEASELEKVLRKTVAWSVRGLVVGGLGGGTYEKHFGAAAERISSGVIRKASKLFEILEPVIPSDERFEQAFQDMKVSKPALARYYLLALENHSRQVGEPELVPNDDEDKVNLEHILPQNPKLDEWAGFSAESAPDYVKRLGNMVLLSKAANRRIGRRPFKDKRARYGESELKTTASVAKTSRWTPKAIRDRQDGLAKAAVIVWPRK